MKRKIPSILVKIKSPEEMRKEKKKNDRTFLIKATIQTNERQKSAIAMFSLKVNLKNQKKGKKVIERKRRKSAFFVFRKNLERR